MISKFHRLGLAMTWVLGAGMLAATAFAHTPVQQQTAPQQQAQSQNKADASQAATTGPAPSDAELTNFAHAVVDVIKVEKTVRPQIQGAKNKGDRDKLVKAANKQITATIRSHHLTLKRYEQIARAVQADPTLRTKVLKLIKAPAKS